VWLSPQLLDAFEIGDNRKQEWISQVTVEGEVYYFPYKYKQRDVAPSQTEYLMVFRLGELYLIRAEARAMQGKLVGENGAAADINIIRERAGLMDVKSLDQSSMRNAVIKEKRVELFSEWGHRWLDIKRIRTVDDIMNITAPIKGGIWQSYKSLYPIPVQDIQRNPNLRGHQNPGYPEA
jgi:hypothetical protein